MGKTGEIRQNKLSELVRSNRQVTFGEQLRIIISLSIPAILAQLSSIIMQYIDASMVGRLGADAAASIGLVSTSTWLFGGLCGSVATGFSVQVAHLIGAGGVNEAKSVLRQALTAALIFSLAMTAIGAGISQSLPIWLGGNDAITGGATLYFRIFALSLPALMMNFLGGSMLRCSGNMVVPGMLNVMMCVLDVLFNMLLIFPTRVVSIIGMSLTIPGASMGVEGAALGTALAEIATMALMLYFLCFKGGDLRLKGFKGSFIPTKQCLTKAFKIGMPMGVEHFILCAAQILTTVIVAPLGTFAIAANAFAITAESLCYMPGYGIGDAATTLIGQSLGAGRKDLTRSFANITVGMGIIVMTIMGIIMYLAAPIMMEIMTPERQIIDLGVMALRTEAFAEPMFAASIVAYGVFVGAGDTLVPCAMNLFSMWAVRLSLAAILAPTMGLHGVWVAMCIELCFRGLIFLLRLKGNKWMSSGNITKLRKDEI
ncbi:MAG: MATE family efflux transporter [Muribaculum sp.]|nr:MATE family efflux transporter [Muribaculum sp.]